MDEEIREVTEEVTEPDTTNEAILEQLRTLNEHLEVMSTTEEEVEEVTTEEVTEQVTEVVTELVYDDPTVDHTLYLSTTVQNADIDDLYAIQLSTRNILLVGFLFGLGFICYRMIRSTVERLLNR